MKKREDIYFFDLPRLHSTLHLSSILLNINSSSSFQHIGAAGVIEDTDSDNVSVVGWQVSVWTRNYRSMLTLLASRWFLSFLSYAALHWPGRLAKKKPIPRWFPPHSLKGCPLSDHWCHWEHFRIRSAEHKKCFITNEVWVLANSFSTSGSFVSPLSNTFGAEHFDEKCFEATKRGGGGRPAGLRVFIAGSESTWYRLYWLPLL